MMKSFDFQRIKRKLYSRLATNKDVKAKEIHGHNSQYYRWQLNKKKINNYVKHRAKQEINKTKGIRRQNVKKKVVIKKQEEDSSSGVNSSEE